MSEPLVVVAFVVVDVVVFVCPSLLFVVVLVLSYPPVIFVLLPLVFVCVFVSSAKTGFANSNIDSIAAHVIKFFIIVPLFLVHLI